MAYSPSTFVNNSTAVPISAAELNKLGTGIALAQAVAEDAALTSATSSATAARISTSLARSTTAVRTADSSAVTATTLTVDSGLQSVLTAITGKRIAVTFHLLYRGDASGSPGIKLGLSATNAAQDIAGEFYLSATSSLLPGNVGTSGAFDSTGKASATAAVLSGTTAGTSFSDVHYAYGFASLLIGPSTGNVTISVLTAQVAAGTGIKLLRGSCLVTERLT